MPNDPGERLSAVWTLDMSAHGSGSTAGRAVGSLNMLLELLLYRRIIIAPTRAQQLLPERAQLRRCARIKVGPTADLSSTAFRLRKPVQCPINRSGSFRITVTAWL